MLLVLFFAFVIILHFLSTQIFFQTALPPLTVHIAGTATAVEHAAVEGPEKGECHPVIFLF